jgi:3-hydroxyacyl-CoA dehydrogenase / enoyl-CoA hydratase / 3-hydroxybutyryl-CoA epimerase
MTGEPSLLRFECYERIATISFTEATLTRRMLRELDRELRALERAGAADILILQGGRPGCFLTGPSLNEYAGLTDDESRRGFAQLGQSILNRLENLSATTATVAFVDGECINAGLELALACDFRLAVARPETRIGFTAISDGLLPGWGGIQRLFRLVGLTRAGELLLNNRLLPARAAKTLGLFDHAFGPRPAKTELNWFIADVQDRGRRADRELGRRSWWTRLRESSKWTRPALKSFDPMGERVVESMLHGWRFGVEEGLAAERNAFSRGAHHPAGEERRRLARQRLDLGRRWREVPGPARVGIHGGSDAAIELAVAALYAGCTLSIFDPNEAERAAIPERLRRATQRAVEQGRFTVLEVEQKLKTIAISSAFDKVDLVLMTGADRAQAAALVELDRRLPAEPILATTSLTLRLAPLALKQPQRTASVHFTSIAAPPTVELVGTRFTDERTIAGLFRWLSQCGFIVNAPELAGATLEAAA